MALIPVLVIINHLLQQKKQKAQDTPTNRWIAVWLVVFALVAFTAWAWALPETPFKALTTYATQIGAVAVLVLAVDAELQAIGYRSQVTIGRRRATLAARLVR